MIIRKPNKPCRVPAAALLALCLSLAAAPAQDIPPQPAEPAEQQEPPAEPAQPAQPAEPAEGTQDAEAAPAAKKNPRRADSFTDALLAAGEDGVAVFCYGPDWNMRSLRMLKSFWNTPELEAATGNAILVAVPFYESPTDEQKQEANQAAGGMKPPPFGVCPTVMLFDKDGIKYANLAGTDHLGQEGNFAQGYQNLRDKLAALRKRNELMLKAESMAGAEKAKVLNEVAELPITPPIGLVEMIKEADPSDSSGMVRRNTFKARDFLYEQMHTKDGFLSPDLIIDFREMEAACMKIIKDESLRPEDRQAAYLLLIGQNRRLDNTGPKLKTLIAACAKLDPNSRYGVLAPALIDHWVPLKNTKSYDAKRAQKQRDRDKAKEVKAKERDSKRADKNTEIR